MQKLGGLVIEKAADIMLSAGLHLMPARGFGVTIEGL